MLDLKIAGGTVVDGTGAPARRADVGIADGRVVAIGEHLGAARGTLDAEGALVVPGFVDLHTHYDGQATWDGALAPSSQHGVTTAVMGNCGVGFAPVRPADHERLIKLMEGVEDIPGSALAEGLDWRWQSFPQYLDALAAMEYSMDVAAQVPHDALRVHVMGERGALGAPASADDLSSMKALLRQALEAGAAGFSTGRTDNHRTAEGRWTPAADAPAAELEALASAFDGLGHGVLQAVSDFDMGRDPERFDAEWSVLERFASAAHGHPLSTTLLERDAAPDQWRRILARAEQAHAKGVPVRVQVAPRPIGVLLGLEASFHPFIGFPTYKAISTLPLAERVARLREPGCAERLLTERSEPLAGDGSPVPPLADALLARLDLLCGRLFPLGAVPDYEPPLSASIAARARERGVPPLRAVLDALLEDEGHALLYFPIFNYTAMSLDHVGEMLRHPLALVGLGDGGAHVGTICDASIPTSLLQTWVRDRTRGERLPVERAIAMLSGDPARHLGLLDRGVLAPERRADVNVLDLASLGLERPRVVRDLPAGGRRFLQESRGYRATLVAGVVTRRDGVATGARPGRLVRLGRA